LGLLSLALASWFLLGAFALEGMLRPFLEAGIVPELGAVVLFVWLSMAPYLMTAASIGQLRRMREEDVPGA
jgi:hypothetical protein